jgi:hypothetical protein
MTKEEIAVLAGTNAYKGGNVGGAYYDTVTLGKDGKFYLSFYSQEKDKREDPACLNESFDMVILKVRSKLIQWENSTKVLESVEYDAGAEQVATTAGDLTEKQAKDRGAKVNKIIYGLYKGKPVKLTVSGGSLFNPDDDEDLRLYNYLQSFEADDHSFMYTTTVKAKSVEYTHEGETKSSYHMTFSKGKPSDLQAVGASLTALVEELVDCDARDLKFLGLNNTPKTPDSSQDIPF